ncbi:hypothetical protein RIF29_12328 [Crotalaria pallida]|uniref:Uncharacterized protein n=1 Tax=Crotalaria pallida TaxID=3830 RepID=A0AAN9IN10_CROPI
MDIVNDIKARLEQAEPPITSDCCIYKVPFDVRSLNQDAYTPKVVSIGPFHHNHPRLQNMERHKLIYCKKFLERAADATLDTLITYVEEVEPSVRRCYADTIEFTNEELVKVILVDSCFIIELFWRFYYDEWSEDDNFLLKPWLTTKIRLDLLLLENQLPFFVLENLFDRAFPSRNGKIPSFLVLTFDYFAFYNSCNLATDNVAIRHFTDLLRIFYLQHPLERRPPRIDESVMQLNSAAELLEAGVKLKVNTKANCLLDLRFSRGILEIPQFRVEDWTELLFRNLVALEQCHYPYESYITDYVAVVDFLINTSRDVDVMVRSGVLVNWLGDSDSVANLYNGLWKNITHVNFSLDYLQLCQGLNGFCKHPRHRLRATLRRDYGNTPWQAAASIAGIILLLLSLLQSVCSVIQVVQQLNASSNS